MYKLETEAALAQRHLGQALRDKQDAAMGLSQQVGGRTDSNS